jgi:hypothetical protein
MHAGLLLYHHVSGGKYPLGQRVMLVHGKDLQKAGEKRGGDHHQQGSAGVCAVIRQSEEKSLLMLWLYE